MLSITCVCIVFCLFMKKLIILLVFVCFIFFVLYKERQSRVPNIFMNYNIDTIDFKTNMDEEFFFHKNFILNNNEDSSEVTTIDFTTFNEKCYISLKIDSTNLSSVLFDTGSDFSLFDINIVNSKRIGRVGSMINTWGKKFSLSEIFIDTIAFGKTVYIPNNEPFRGYMRPLNIIGGEIMKHFVWKIDNLRRKIYFSQDTSVFMCDDCVAVPFVMNKNIPFIKCIVNDREYSVMVDTGNSGFLHIIDESEMNNNQSFSHQESRDSFYCTMSVFDDSYNIFNYGLSENAIRECRTISDIKINDLSFKDEIIEHNKYQSNILGWDFLQRFEFVILDYINQIMYLGPVDELKTFSYMRDIRSYINTTGIMSSFIKPNIITALTDSLIKKGISLGDTIIAVDGAPVTNLELLKAIYSRESAEITVKGETYQRDIILYRKHYISEPDTVMTFGEVSLIPLYKRMSIVHPIIGGRRILYFDWNPPYLMGDYMKIFD